jgi:flagellar basal-body rod protein FlgC
MDLNRTIGIAASSLKAQSGRMRGIAENPAIADSTAPQASGEPYRRKIPTFASRFHADLDARVVGFGAIVRDRSAFRQDYEPGNPAADAKSHVRCPNVNPLAEHMNLRKAQRSYEAHPNVIGAARRMIARTLDILRG